MVWNRSPRSFAFEDPRRAVEQQVDLVPEVLVQRLVGETALILGVAALEDDGQLPSGEHVVPADCRNVAARSQRRIARSALGGREGDQRQTSDPSPCPSGRVPSGPGWKMSAQARSTIGSPIAAISQSTTASSRGGAVGSEQDVVELVVTVAQGARLGKGTVLPQPVGHPTGTGQVPTAVGVELGEPTGQLSRQVVVAVGQIAQAACLPVDGVDRHEGVDELLERPPV